ncbi:MAG: dTMP kinase [Thermofilum sp. ex4484_82]|nr:MAG: dTMP kinase [Thermofilum sp. ex4484_82]OYT38361.1 MAG: dTMP kinase [Archaeoglobales archaeon ex4484_92]
MVGAIDMVLVQVEGTDGVGKTTVVNLLREELDKENVKVKVLVFPSRETRIGSIIDEMLKKRKFEWNEAVIFQLLQTANRLEFYKEIERWREKKDSVLILDRYVLSGLVYGKLDGVPYNSLMTLQLLLPPPQLNIVLTANRESLERRLKEKMQLEIYERIEKILKIQKEYMEVSKDYEKNVEQKFSLSIQTVFLDNSDGKLEYVIREAKNRILSLLSMEVKS